MTDKMLKKQAFEAADRLMGTFEEISDYVFKHPELGGDPPIHGGKQGPSGVNTIKNTDMPKGGINHLKGWF